MTIDEVAEWFHELDDDRPAAFDRMAEAVFRFQVKQNPVYGAYADVVESWDGWQNVPYLPVEAFKLASVCSFPPKEAERVFESSGTRGSARSKHYVRDLAIYDRSALTHFERVFGNRPGIILGHLPRYSEMGERSSLVHMVGRIIDLFGSEGSGFFLDEARLLDVAVERATMTGDQILIFGAAFGLLDLVEERPRPLPPSSIVVETGGMKTHRRSIGREELHRRLAEGFGLARRQIYSEYGMCELLSQAYTRGGTVFYPPPWMKFAIVDPENPIRRVDEGTSGALALFDLANVYSVSAVITQDRAVRRNDGFEVLGRMSGAELRGCNFLLEERLP